MNYSEIKPNTYYEVTKRSKDGTFMPGMMIRKLDDGDIAITVATGGGIIEKGDLEKDPKLSDFEAQPWEWYYGESLIDESLEEPDPLRKFSTVQEAITYFRSVALAHFYVSESQDRQKKRKKRLSKNEMNEASKENIPALSKDYMQVAEWLEKYAEAEEYNDRLQDEIQFLRDELDDPDRYYDI